jgi:hypothetical protein
MNKNTRYMFKFLQKAIDELVTGSEDIRSRIIHAGEHFTTISIESIPSHLQPEALEILKYLTEYKAKPGASFPYDSDVRVTIRRRRKSTAVKTAKRMWSLYLEYKEFLDSEFYKKISIK